MIPAEVIVDVRARNEIVGFIESSWVQLRRRGADYVGLSEAGHILGLHFRRG